MKMSKSVAKRKIMEHREDMFHCATKEAIVWHKERACEIQSAEFSHSCNSKDCRYCFLERDMNKAIENLELKKLLKSMVTVNGNVTINGNITINIK